MLERVERMLTPTPPLMVPSPFDQFECSMSDLQEAERNDWCVSGWDDIINPLQFCPKEDYSPMLAEISNLSVSNKQSLLQPQTLCREWEQKPLIQWDSRDVINWLAAVSLERQIDCEHLNMANFSTVTGMDLMRMAERDFWTLNPAYGHILFSELQSLFQRHPQHQQPSQQQQPPHMAYEEQPQPQAQQQQQQPVLATLQPASQFSQQHGYNMSQQFNNTCVQSESVLPSFVQLRSYEEYGGLTQTPMFNNCVPHVRVSSPECSSTGSEGDSEVENKDDLGWASPKMTNVTGEGIDGCYNKKRIGRPKKPEGRSKKNERAIQVYSRIMSFPGKKCGRLWEFLRDLLKNPKHCPSLVRWEDHDTGTFRFMNSEKVAQLWGEIKGNPRMNYEKLSRAMRYYYKSEVLLPVLGRRLVYKFGPNAKEWRSDNPNFAHSL